MLRVRAALVFVAPWQPDLIVIPRFTMSRQSLIPQSRKKPGPPATGKGLQVGTRWHEPLLGMIDAWAARQDDKPPRSEAIRRLVERGLAAEPAPAKPRRPMKKDNT
jgi:hypothetical protein